MNSDKDMNLVEKGSQTAKNGFKNEDYVVLKFNNWKTDKDAQEWLKIMNYNLQEIEKVEAVKIKGHFKSDIQAKVKIYLKNVIDAQNISIKLISNKSGFNQIDKRYVEKYSNLWNIPKDISLTLKKFTGEIACTNENIILKDTRRIFLNEMDFYEVEKVINFFEKNKIIIITDLLKGRGQFAAEWMLIIKKIMLENEKPEYSWVLKPMNIVMNYFGSGKILITKNGNLKIGKITMQRKGGDGGRKTANMLQFKINPAELFNI